MFGENQKRANFDELGDAFRSLAVLLCSNVQLIRRLKLIILSFSWLLGDHSASGF